jgi:2-dehydro-3-deoxyglucarate aldolase
MAKPFKTALAQDGPQVGILLSLPSPEMAEISLEAGFDWLFIDMEHGLLDFASVQRMVQAAAGRVPCLVRVAANDPAWIGKALDTGADGLIFPHVNSAAEAAACVRAALYSPRGARSIGVARSQGYGAGIHEDLASATSRVTLIAQAEHIDAARAIDSILDVPGLDAVFVGPLDLSASLGIPGRTDDARVQDAIGVILAAARTKKIPAGIFAPGVAAARAALSRGFSFVAAGTDGAILAEAARALVDGIR